MTPTQMLAVAIAAVVGLAVLFLLTRRRGAPTRRGTSEPAPQYVRVQLPPAREPRAPAAQTPNDAALRAAQPPTPPSEPERTRAVEAPPAEATERITSPGVFNSPANEVLQGERITLPIPLNAETVRAPAPAPPAPAPAPTNERAALPLLAPTIPVAAPTVPVAAPTPLAAFVNVTSPTAELERNDPRHQSARRFARVAVGEIKLYHESDVADGRVAKDLWRRLRRDIDMCIQAYEKRVPADVRDRFDYLYDEIVRQLAEGDPSKLGADAPTCTIPKR
ncbi:MAG: hypothetical protein FWD69_13885 [Polyangiaceae bacterium]|nr:hypothetical protein [Polyangiaceae bacterium]